MKIGIITRPNEHKWGGDLKALYSIKKGLLEHDQEVILGGSALQVLDADFIFITNTCLDQRSNHTVVEMFNKPYGTIGFHDDYIKYYSTCMGFLAYVEHCLGLGLTSDNGLDFDIERLFEIPEIIYYYSDPPKKSSYYNYQVLKNAKVCIATSPTEASTLKRDCPSCNAQVVYLSSETTDSSGAEHSEDFLSFSGLEKGSYILQVGRIEPRKNQLASILATKDMEYPLVFIATESYYPHYENICLEAIRKWRKAETFIISQTMEPRDEGALKVLAMPKDRPLPYAMIQQAYQNAGLHLHPAFYELPGYVYLESAKLGVPTIASKWTSITDYFFDPLLEHSSLDGRIRYCTPYHLNEIKTLIKELFGKKFPPNPTHSIFERTDYDVAKEILHRIFYTATGLVL